MFQLSGKAESGESTESGESSESGESGESSESGESTESADASDSRFNCALCIMNILLSLQFVSVVMRFLREIMESQKNVFIKSAELGVPFGCMLIVASLSMIFGDRVPLLSTLMFIIAIIAPFLIFRWQRKRFIESNGFASFSELWNLGIFTTICGAMMWPCDLFRNNLLASRFRI